MRGLAAWLSWEENHTLAEAAVHATVVGGAGTGGNRFRQ